MTQVFGCLWAGQAPGLLLFTDLVFKAPRSLFEKLRDFHSKGAISEI